MTLAVHLNDSSQGYDLSGFADCGCKALTGCAQGGMQGLADCGCSSRKLRDLDGLSALEDSLLDYHLTTGESYAAPLALAAQGYVMSGGSVLKALLWGVAGHYLPLPAAALAGYKAVVAIGEFNALDNVPRRPLPYAMRRRRQRARR